MTKPAPLYPVRRERIIRALQRPPIPDLLLDDGPTARLTRGFFATVADVTNVLGEAHALAQMTRDDLARLVALGERARAQLEELR